MCDEDAQKEDKDENSRLFHRISKSHCRTRGGLCATTRPSEQQRSRGRASTL